MTLTTKKLEDLIPPFTDEFQELEYVLQELYETDNVDLMEGENLKALANLVGQETLSVTDSILRRFVKAKAVQKQSTGKYMDIYHVVKYLTDSTNVKLTEMYPAGIVAYVDGDIPSGWEDYVRKFINDTCAICVSIEYMQVFPTDGWFMLGENGSTGYINNGLSQGKLGEALLS